MDKQVEKKRKVFEMSKFGMDFTVIIDQPSIIAKATLEYSGKDPTEFKNGEIIGRAKCRTDMDKFSTRYGVLLAVKRALCKYHGIKAEEHKREAKKHKKYMAFFKENLNGKMGEPQPLETK